MRTLIFILVGLAAVSITLWRVSPARRVMAAWLFSTIWLAVSLLNLRIGLSHGYGLREELLVHLPLFGIPVLAAWLAVWKLRGV